MRRVVVKFAVIVPAKLIGVAVVIVAVPWIAVVRVVRPLLSGIRVCVPVCAVVIAGCIVWGSSHMWLDISPVATGVAIHLHVIAKREGRYGKKKERENQ